MQRAHVLLYGNSKTFAIVQTSVSPRFLSPSSLDLSSFTLASLFLLPMLGYETRRVREARIPVSHFSRVERRRATLENVIFRRNRRRVYARARARTFHARWPYLILRQVRPAYWFLRGLPFHGRISSFSTRYSLLRIYRRGWVPGYSRNSEQGFRSGFVEFVVRDDATFFTSYSVRKITNATRPRASPPTLTSIGDYVSSIRLANPMESRDAGVQVRVASEFASCDSSRWSLDNALPRCSEQHPSRCEIYFLRPSVVIRICY